MPLSRATLSHPPSARHPDSLFLMAVAIFSGIAQIIEREAGSVMASFSYTVAVIYSATLILGGALVLVGAYWREPIFGIVFEIAGRWVLFASCLVYLGAALPVVENPFVFPVMLVLGLACSCILRFQQLRKTLRTERMRVSLELKLRREAGQ